MAAISSRSGGLQADRIETIVGTITAPLLLLYRRTSG